MSSQNDWQQNFDSQNAKTITALSTFHLGMQVITSCNSTQQELQEEFEAQFEVQLGSQADSLSHTTSKSKADHKTPTDHPTRKACFEYVDHVRTHPKFKFGGMEGTKVCTVAFKKVV